MYLLMFIIIIMSLNIYSYDYAPTTVSLYASSIS